MKNPNFKLISINVSRFDSNKHMAQSVIGDAKISLQDLTLTLGNWRAPMIWQKNLEVLLNYGIYLEKKVVQQIKSYHHTPM